jgi:hypothetical protein
VLKVVHERLHRGCVVLAEAEAGMAAADLVVDRLEVEVEVDLDDKSLEGPAPTAAHQVISAEGMIASQVKVSFLETHLGR